LFQFSLAEIVFFKSSSLEIPSSLYFLKHYSIMSNLSKYSIFLD
jgi:hypothetical protein